MRTISSFQAITEATSYIESDSIANSLGNLLSVEVTGTATSFQLQVYGQSSSAETWHIISGKTLTDSTSVTTAVVNGLYYYPILGVTNVKIVVSGMDGAVSVFTKIFESEDDFSQASTYSTSSSGGTTSTTVIIDNLTSFSTSAALSANQGRVLKNSVAAKQDTLVSGTSLKTINGETLLGSGNISMEIINALNSNSTTAALSANQGKILNESISTVGIKAESIEKEIADLTAKDINLQEQIDALSSQDIDLTDYDKSDVSDTKNATVLSTAKKYTDDEIAKISIPDVSGFATTTQLELKADKTVTESLATDLVNISASVTQAEKDIDALESEVTNLGSSIKTLDDDISELQDKDSAIEVKITTLENADTNLQAQINALKEGDSVKDIVTTYEELLALDKADYEEGALVKVLADTNYEGVSTYYKLESGNWEYYISLSDKGTVVTIGGVEEASVGFTSDPQTQIDNINSSIEDINTAINDLDTTYATKVELSDKADTSVTDSLSTDILNQGVEITSLDSRISANETELANLGSNITTLDNDLESLETKVDALSGVISFLSVDERPNDSDAKENIIYLVPNEEGTKDEWMFVDGKWDPIGTTSVNLEGYVEDGDLETALSNVAKIDEGNIFVEKQALEKGVDITTSGRICISDNPESSYVPSFKIGVTKESEASTTQTATIENVGDIELKTSSGSMVKYNGSEIATVDNTLSAIPIASSLELGLVKIALDSAVKIDTQGFITIDIEDVERGETGMSAYELAVQEGFEGTLEEWLDQIKGDSAFQDWSRQEGNEGKEFADFMTEITGPQGEKGDQGDIGPQGEQGEKGEIGESLRYEDLTEEQIASFQGDQGPQGDAGLSAYALAVANGFEGNYTEWAETLIGASAYEDWKTIEGNEEKTLNDFIAALKGENGIDGIDGDSAYIVAVNEGFIGTVTEWLTSLKGADGATGESGKSAYEIAFELDNTIGTEAEWLANLEGEDGEAGISAYQVALNEGYVGTEAEWLASLRGEDGSGAYTEWLKIEGNEGKTIEEYLATIKGEKGDQGDIGPQGIQGEQGEQGIQGIQGIAGQDGANGEDGTALKVDVSVTTYNFLSNYMVGDQWVSKIALCEEDEEYYTYVYNEETQTIRWTNLPNVGTGIQGKDGKDGEQGIQGEQGVQGIQGEQGVAGADGEKGEDGLSAYEVAVEEGFEGTVGLWLESLQGADGANGKSNYEIAVEEGYEGTQGQWIDSVKGVAGDDGADGKSAYDLAVEAGYEGSVGQWVESLQGADGIDGKSAFDIAVEGGYEGTLDDWLEDMCGPEGKNVYETWLVYNPDGTFEEFMDSLRKDLEVYEQDYEVISDSTTIYAGYSGVFKILSGVTLSEYNSIIVNSPTVTIYWDESNETFYGRNTGTTAVSCKIFAKRNQGIRGRDFMADWLYLNPEATEEDFYDAFRGKQGYSSFELWTQEKEKTDPGVEWSIDDYFDSLVGATGESAYEVWLAQGNGGTEEDFLRSITPQVDASFYVEGSSIGTIHHFYRSDAPFGYHAMDGTTLSATDYPEWYSYCYWHAKDLLTTTSDGLPGAKVPTANDGRFLRGLGYSGSEYLTLSSTTATTCTDTVGTLRNGKMERTWGIWDGGYNSSSYNGTSGCGYFVSGGSGARYDGSNYYFGRRGYDSQRQKYTTAGDTRPKYMAVGMYIKVMSDTSSRNGLVGTPKEDYEYYVGNLIQLNGLIYRCIETETWTGTLTDNWVEAIPSEGLIETIVATCLNPDNGYNEETKEEIVNIPFVKGYVKEETFNELVAKYEALLLRVEAIEAQLEESEEEVTPEEGEAVESEEGENNVE